PKRCNDFLCRRSVTDVEDGLADRRDSFYSESLAHAVKGAWFFSFICHGGHKWRDSNGFRSFTLLRMTVWASLSLFPCIFYVSVSPVDSIRSLLKVIARNGGVLPGSNRGSLGGV